MNRADAAQQDTAWLMRLLTDPTITRGQARWLDWFVRQTRRGKPLTPRQREVVRSIEFGGR